MENPDEIKVVMELTTTSADWAEGSFLASHLSRALPGLDYQDMGGRTHSIGDQFTITRCEVTAFKPE